MCDRDDTGCCERTRRRRTANGIGGSRRAGRWFGFVIVAITVAAALTSGPVAAQESDGETSTTAGSTETTVVTTASTTPSSTSEVPETTTTDPSPASSEATNGSGEPTTGSTEAPSDSSTETTASSTTVPPEGEATDSSDTTDPLIGEAPADDPLDPNITVPPPTGADAEVDFAPVPILWSSVREAEAKWADAKSAKIEAVAEVRTLRLRAKELGLRQEELEDQTKLTIEELTEATDRLRARAVRGFVHTSSGNASGANVGTEIFRSRELLITQRKNRLIGAVVDVDRVGLAELDDLRSTLGTSAFELLRRSGVVKSSIRRAETIAAELDVAVDQAQIELEAFKAGSEIYVDGVVFPIGGPYSVPLINSFGFPRMPGTPDAHSHQGIDIFAARGTPLVAAERGVVGRVGIGRLGGLKLWLRGESGADWYYAHLDGFAPGLHNGQVVEAGELLGYVGNTGNAVGTPPHLHLEIHPGGGAAVNPYPLLKVVSDLDLNSVVDGTDPGFRYQPVVRSTPPPTIGSEALPETTTTSAPTTVAPDATTTPTTVAAGPSESTTTESAGTEATVTNPSQESSSTAPESTTVPTTAPSVDSSTGG